ncbi:MAG: ribonuclease P protein component [Chloroflexaceae bacterium]|nr:ribonuclease P protein component [Chloroflexaceae bacterium]
MKRAYRLRRPEQFQRVRREGRTLEHSLVRLNVAPNRRRKTRCGFVVGKRVGNAVTRNRARRRTREAVRLVFRHIAEGIDLVFVIRSQKVAEVAFPVLQSAIEQLLRRAGVWAEEEASEEG